MKPQKGCGLGVELDRSAQQGLAVLAQLRERRIADQLVPVLQIFAGLDRDLRTEVGRIAGEIECESIDRTVLRAHIDQQVIDA